MVLCAPSGRSGSYFPDLERREVMSSGSRDFLWLVRHLSSAYVPSSGTPRPMVFVTMAETLMFVGFTNCLGDSLL